MRRVSVLLAVALLLSGCYPTYTLVKPEPLKVAQGAMKVRPSIAWNKEYRSDFDIKGVEHWTQNGPLLDQITFVAGLKDGTAITRQKSKDDRKVPVFRSSMTPPDFVSMVESYYRVTIGVTVFETTNVSPAQFLRQPAVELNFNYVGSDDVKRRGRAVSTVVDGKLYLMLLEGTALHYFDAALPEFESLVASATIS